MERSKGKGVQNPCVICGEDRLTHGAHFPKPKRKGGTETIPMCPTHHALVDNGRLSLSELKVIWKREYPRFESFEDFMKWAIAEGYPYSEENILQKDFWKDYDERDISYKVSNLPE